MISILGPLGNNNAEDSSSFYSEARKPHFEKFFNLMLQRSGVCALPILYDSALGVYHRGLGGAAVLEHGPACAQRFGKYLEGRAMLRHKLDNSVG
jgi:hypothetical protein